jgi:hypothetical protein
MIRQLASTEPQTASGMLPELEEVVEHEPVDSEENETVNVS